MPESNDSRISEMLEQLFSFVERVSSEDGNKMPEEVEALPAIAKILLEYC